ncbi:DUF742 domain-containing protein [Streptomyces sp. NPDC054796]
MSWDPDVPDRWFVMLGGRTRADHDFDLVSLIVTERAETAGLEPEEAHILTRCAAPTAVVELSSLIGAPLGVVCVLLSGLLDRGYITARHPSSPASHTPSDDGSLPRWTPDSDALKRVLHGLRKL